MFLYQKLKYDYKHIDITNKREAVIELGNILKRASEIDKPPFIFFDTEATGLNTMKAEPFLVSIGFAKTVRTFDYDKQIVELLWKIYEMSKVQQIPDFLGLGAHNCKFDYHIVWNGGAKIPDSIKLFDSITVARLTEYADEKESMSLEHLGSKYVDENSKFAGKVIKDIIKKINKQRREDLRLAIMNEFPNDGFFTVLKSGKRKGTSKLTEIIDNYEKKRVQFIDDDNKYYNFIDTVYKPANYKDAYEADPELMRSYAADDAVIAIEYLNKAIVALRNVDEGLRVFNREGELIKVVAEMEKNGLKVDVDYVLSSRKKVIAYKDLLYFELGMITGEDFTVGQHEVIKRLLLSKYSIKTDKTDEKALKYIRDKATGEVIDVVNLILELRTIDKWLSTYIDGKLNEVINGRIHTDINNNGAVSGRVSCNMQQQPKDALLDRDENELFHPRKMFIPDEGHNLVFIDESQMELRVQAFYTVLTAPEPDYKMCRAYMPYKCWHYQTKEPFDYKNKEHIRYKWKEVRDDCPPINTFREGLEEALKEGWSVWEDENGHWRPTDLHSETASHAFPEFNKLDPIADKKKWKGYRNQAKTCNFLKVYQGGVLALQETIECSREIAEALDSAFYKSFPKVKDYQNWVNQQASLYGYVENLYGRRYYMNDSKWFYKLCNYLIQGSCADMVKLFQIKIHNFIKENNLKTKMLLPVHDEIIFLVPHGEEKYVRDFQAIMEDVTDVITYLPMVAEIEYSSTNWKEKKGWDL